MTPEAEAALAASSERAANQSPDVVREEARHRDLVWLLDRIATALEANDSAVPR